jgi:transposase, IS30 family
MPKGYQQLTATQRSQINALKSINFSNRRIAKELAVSHTTINNELKRNTGKRGYTYQQAHKKAQKRKQQPKPSLRKLTSLLLTLLEEKITQEQWSPQQISEWLRLKHNKKISHETIYQHIYQNQKKGGTLHTHLRRKCKPYQKRINGKTNRGQIVGRVDISQRPEIVETRGRLGDWEADTVVGKSHKSAVVTLVERKSRALVVFKVTRSTAEIVSAGIIEALKHLPVKTITFDNGKEFSYHYKIASALGVATYFAKPYHSWERGTNENTNGLLRQYFPKGTDFGTVSEAEVLAVQEKLNRRPRKCLGFKTPLEVLHAVA